MSTFSIAPAVAQITFTGLNGAGSISVPGLKVGDMVLTIANGSGSAVGGFETQITVDDEIQQTAGFNVSTVTYTAVLARTTT